MKNKIIIDERFSDYSRVSMFIGTCSCDGKCCTEAGIPLSVCINDDWRTMPIQDTPDEEIIERYRKNPITQAIVIGGLEPFEQFPDMRRFLRRLREEGVDDEVIIYTGYTPEEIENELAHLRSIPNIIVKFGRYIPDRAPVQDPLLGVRLASDNQYAERIS